VIYTVLGIICLAVALVFNLSVDSMFEVTLEYAGTGDLTFTVPRNFTGQLFVYYEITGFHQNSFLYAPSLNWPQLRGQDFKSLSELESCRPLTRSSAGLIVPCGAVPASVFNDTFEFSPNFPELTREGIALPAFRNHFAAPAARYAGEDQWLNNSELFPGGQTDERFINWVRISGFSPFRKLWAKSISAVKLIGGHEYTVKIESNFPVFAFGGSKAIVLAEVSWLGGKNSFFELLFYIMTGLSSAAALGYALAALFDWFPLYRQIACGMVTMPERSAASQSLLEVNA
jgi:hypothetical protein